MKCGKCVYMKDGLCTCNFSDKFRTIVRQADSCLFIRRMTNNNIVVRGGDFTRKEIMMYVEHLKEKHPLTHFGTITLEQDKDYVLITYEVLPENVERVRKIDVR